MYGYIYMTTNTVNGKRYIGKHKASKFTKTYRGSGKILVQAFKKYGFDKFDVELLEECEDLEQLNKREEYWIAKYNACDSDEFYNIRWGGQGGDVALFLPKERMQEIRKDHSEYIKDRLKEDREFHSKFAGAKQGHICYQTTKDKISEGQKKYWASVDKGTKHERLSRSATTRMTGKIWVTDDVKDKSIRPEELNEYLAKGYRQGRRFVKRNRKCKKR